MARRINQILEDLNTKIAGRITYANTVFNELAVLQPLDNNTFPLIRMSDSEGDKISPLDTQGLIFYHRMLSEDREDIQGKGSAVYYRVIYNMVLVGIGYRPNITISNDWNNEDIAQDIMNSMGQNAVLDFKEMVLVQGRPVTDKLTVINEEYGENARLRSKVLDLIAFKIPYTLKVNQLTCEGSVSPVTSLTVDPQEQLGNDGDDITQINITTDSASIIEASNLPSTVSFEILTNSSARVTGTFPSSNSIITFLALGAGGGRLTNYAELNLSGGSTPVTGLIYDNDNQTIWNESGVNGVFINSTPTVDPCNATGTYSSSDIVAGMQLDSVTGIISVLDYSLISVGTNSFTVTFTASGSFSGIVDYLFTFTKEALWMPEDITPGQVTLQNWYDPTEDESDYLTITSGAVSAWADRSALYNLTQTTPDRRPLPGTWGIDSKRSVFWINDNMFNSSVTSTNDLWAFFHVNISSIVTNQYLMRSVTPDIRVGMDTGGAANCRVFVRAGGITSFIGIPDSFDEFQSNLLLSIHLNDTNVDVYINGGLIGSAVVGAHSGMSGQYILCAFQNGGSSFSCGGYHHESLIADNTGTGLTTSDQQRIEGYTAWKRGSQDSLVDGHPYKNLPPFI